MANGSVIKEFLISLGATTDVKPFFLAIEGMTKAMAKFALGLETMVDTLKVALIKTASTLEKLYYTARRAGTTVESLKMVQYGIRQIGLSAEDASGALDGLASSLRSNPGNETLMRYLGVQTRTLAGGMRDSTDVMGDFIVRLGKMPYYIAMQYASMFGINERTLYQLLHNFGELRSQEELWKRMARGMGVDLNAAGEQSHKFMSSLRELGETIELMWIKISTPLLEKLDPQIREFSKFLQDNAKEITDFFRDIGVSILGLGDDLESVLGEVEKLIKKTVGWKTVLEGVADVIALRIFGPLGLAVSLAYQFWNKITKDNKEDDKSYESLGPDGKSQKDKDAEEKRQLGSEQFTSQNREEFLKKFFTDGEIADMKRFFRFDWVPQGLKMSPEDYGGEERHPQATPQSYTAPENNTNILRRIAYRSAPQSNDNNQFVGLTVSTESHKLLIAMQDMTDAVRRLLLRWDGLENKPDDKQSGEARVIPAYSSTPFRAPQSAPPSYTLPENGTGPYTPSDGLPPVPPPRAGKEIDTDGPPHTGDMRYPRGIRNNNPGNIRAWPGTGSDGSFAIFRSAMDGLVAMRDNLRAYSDKHHIDTLRGVVNRWAPPKNDKGQFENDTSAYLASMAKLIGINPDSHIDLHDPAILSRIMQGFARLENGGMTYSRDMFDRAARAPLGGRQSAPGPVSMKQDVHINVRGDEPVATAREVRRQQDNASAMLVRHFRTAVIA